MAACLRSLRLGMPPLVPGGAAVGGVHLGRTTRPSRRPAQSISSLHITSSNDKATPAPQQQQQQQQRKMAGGSVEGIRLSTPIPFHSFHPLIIPACPSAHTLDDIEVQCLTSKKQEIGNDDNSGKQGSTMKTAVDEEAKSRSVRVFCLPPNAIWYPRKATHLKNGSALCSASYNQLETQVMECISEGPYYSQAPPQTPPREATENGECAQENVLGGGRKAVGEDDGLNWSLGSGILEVTEEYRNSGEDDKGAGEGHRAAIEEGKRWRTRWEGGEGHGSEGDGPWRLGGDRHWGTSDMGSFIRKMGVRDAERESCYLSSSLSCSSLSSSSSPSSSSSSSSSSSGNMDASGRPNPEQLSIVFNKLAETLPKLFVQPLDYTIYAQNIVFENRIRGVRTVGLFPYVRQVALLRTIGHLRFAYVKFEILKITKHPEEGTVKVRWRIKGLSGYKAILQFWKLRLWDWSTVEAQMVSWYDGFSTFHIASDGLIHLHVADSMMPDEEARIVNTKGPLAVKMAALLGLVPRPSSGSLNSTPDPPAPPAAAVKAAEGISVEGVRCRGVDITEPATTTTTTTTTTVSIGDDSTTTTTTSCLLGLLEEERESCAGLMLPLEEIF